MKSDQPKKEQAGNEVQVVEPTLDTTLAGEDGIENTVKAYNITMRNALLADPYFKVLRKYATEKEVKRVFVDVEYDMQKGVAMRSWQRELVFDNISASGREGYADTSETWDFEYVDLKTKEVVDPKKTMKYKLRYTLEKEEERWVVSKMREREPSVVTKTVSIPLESAPK